MNDPLAAARERGRLARVDEALVEQIAARIQNQGQAVCDIDDARALLSQFYASQAEVARLRATLSEYADPDNWQDSLTARLDIFTGQGDYGWSLAFAALDDG